MLRFFEDIEMVLGGSQDRYFGSRYLQTRQILREFLHVRISEAEFRFSGTGSVIIPEIWSVKNDKAQKPHLSSIDAIEFAIQAIIEVHAVFGCVREISYNQIIRIEIIAGTKPLEEDLSGFVISGKAFLDKNFGEVTIEMLIGTMKSKIKFRLATQAAVLVLFPKSPVVAVKDLSINEEEKSATAVLHPVVISESSKWSLASCFANVLQIGQALMYSIDRIDRESSNTLWMRKVVITVSEEVAVQSGKQSAHVSLKNFKLLKHGAEQWRCADIDAVLCGANIICSVAHILSGSRVKSESEVLAI